MEPNQRFNGSPFLPPYERRNHHVISYKGLWCVHGELSREVKPFESREEAIEFARQASSAEKTDAIVHREDGSVETAWIYSPTSFPQASVHPPCEYPLQQLPGDTVL